MKKKIGLLLASSSLMGALLIGFAPDKVNAASVDDGIIKSLMVRPEDTDLISIWRVTSSGYIYSPVSVTTTVQINSTTSGSDLVATRRELISQTHVGSFDVYPNATFGPGLLNLRGSNVNLPNQGSYIHDPDYVVAGKYNDSSATYSNSPSSAYGQTVFMAGSGGFQIDNTASVDFTW